MLPSWAPSVFLFVLPLSVLEVHGTDRDRPVIRKLGTLDLLAVETTPVVYRDRLYRFEDVRKDYHANKTGDSHFRFIDVETGKKKVKPKEADAISRPTPTYADPTFGYGHDGYPVLSITHHAAMEYCRWLSEKTGATYRLLSESEREYVTRGCTSPACPSTAFWFGDDISPARANYDWRYSYAGSAKAQPLRRTIATTDAAQANPFGLLQVHGNVREWVEDCWNPTLAGLPKDGAPRLTGDCRSHVLRGGSWSDHPEDLRSAKRSWDLADERRAQYGLRVARVLQN